MKICCGIDWAESHHDVALVDDAGILLAKRRITDDAAGFRLLLDLLAECGDTADEPIPVAIETSRGLLVAALRTGKRPVFAINRFYTSRSALTRLWPYGVDPYGTPTPPWQSRTR